MIIAIFIYDLGPDLAGRFLGFSLYVSNTTEISEENLCFKDTSFTANTIPPVFTTTCPVRGQYVIVYNERLPSETYPDGYSKYAFLDLCEVEVYGKYQFHMFSKEGGNIFKIILKVNLFINKCMTIISIERWIDWQT